MKEFKGTKGEWYIKDDFRSPKILNESGKVMFTHAIDCYDTDEKAHNYYSHNKMMANAKLTIASKDLLEAAKIALEMCEDKIMPTEEDLNVLAVELRKVLNKAL